MRQNVSEPSENISTESNGNVEYHPVSLAHISQHIHDTPDQIINELSSETRRVVSHVQDENFLICRLIADQRFKTPETLKSIWYTFYHIFSTRFLRIYANDKVSVSLALAAQFRQSPSSMLKRCYRMVVTVASYDVSALQHFL